MRKILLYVVLFSVLLLSSSTFATVWWTGTPDYVINETSHFDAGTKVNTSTTTDEYNHTTDTLEMSFPYADKDGSLVSYHRLEGLTDETGRYDLTAGGSPVLSTSDCIFDYCYDIEETDSVDPRLEDTTYIDLSAQSSFTIMMWIKPESRTYAGLMLGKIPDGVNDGMVLRDRTDSYAQIYYYTPIGTHRYMNSVSTFSGWTYMTATITNTAVQLYVNGVATGSQTSAGTTSISLLDTDTFIIGSQPGYDEADGKFDEVKVYNRTLSATEIRTLYNSAKRYINTGWGNSQAIWTSDTQTMTVGYVLKNMTINLTANTFSNITKIEWVADDDSAVLASNETDITSTDAVTYSITNGLTSGSFNSIDEDFKIKIYYSGNGTSTAIIDDIIGFTGPNPGMVISRFGVTDVYDSNGYVNNIFAQGQNITITTNLTTNVQGGEYYPLITFYYPNGTNASVSHNMSNITVMANTDEPYSYNYTIPDNTPGFWSVKIQDSFAASSTKNNLFYVGQLWTNNWTNSSGTTFPFRFKINISDKDIIDRKWEAIDAWVNFSYTAHNNSIRVGYYNSSHIIEIPSQYYNNTTSIDGTFSDANIVFLSSLERNQNKTFYVYYSKYDLGAPVYDIDIVYSNQSNKYVVNNSYYNITNDKGKGGIIEYLKTASGTSLAGNDPFEYGAELTTVTGGAKAVSSVTSPEYVSFITGPVFSKIVISSRYLLPGSVSYYNLTYTYYGNAPYYIEEINTTVPVAEAWTSYYDFKIFLADSIFYNVSWLNSTQNIPFTVPVTSGDGSDIIETSNMSWLAFYNNDTDLGYGEIFLARNSSDAMTPIYDYYDMASYEIFQRRVTGVYSPGSGDYVYAKKAGVIFNGIAGINRFNETYYMLAYPSNITVNYTSETFDEISPQYTDDVNYHNVTPESPSDSESITCFSYWIDNLGIDHVTLSQNSSGIFVENATSYTNTTGSVVGWANHTITTSNPGLVFCNFTAYDIAGNINSTNFSFTVSDITKPNISNVSYTPTSVIDLDPNVNITVSANVTDTSIVGSVILQYHLNGTEEWTNITMSVWTDDIYNATFTPTEAGNYTIRVWASDTSANSNYSDSQNISVAYDRTWYLSPSTFSVVTATYLADANITNITINNTGDYSLNFSITSSVTSNTYDTSLFVYSVTNKSIINVSNMTSVAVSINTTAPAATSTNAITFTVTANDTTENSTSQTQTGTFYVTPAGPYLVLTMIGYPTVIYPTNTTKLNVSVQNLGSETATNVWIKWTLPTGWQEDTGIDNLNWTVGDLEPYEIGWNNLTIVTLSSSAGTGIITLFAESNSTDGGYGNVSKLVTVLSATTTTTTETTTTTTTSGGGGGGGGGISAGQSEKLFQTSDTYELVHGQDSEFTMTVENPFPNSTMNNVTLKVTGLLSKYITTYPTQINEIKVNKSKNFTIKITAPSYFTTGTHKLLFEIRSSVTDVNTGKVSDMIEDRSITLAVHDISRAEATTLTDKAIQIFDEMKNNNLYTVAVSALINQLNTAYENRDYEQVQSTYEQIQNIYDSAMKSSELISEIEQRIFDAANLWGLSTEKTQRILNLARLAFERGDYAKALERMQEAQLTFALETKGEYNIPFIIIHYWYYIIVGTLITSFVLFLIYKRLQLAWFNHKIKSYTDEEQILLGLMKQVQRDAFEKNKMSIGEYNTAMFEYSKRLNEVVKRLIENQTKKAHVFTFGPEETTLLDERKKLTDLIKETQTKYLSEGKYETRTYMDRMRSYSERLSEIQEKLSTIEANRALKKKRTKLLSRIRGI